ncbi:MAG: tetratricopeptide repeat protein [Hyphomicrobium sp.]|nr:tetratricopeptide repeat protein [Hyphomicrobium sp.]
MRIADLLRGKPMVTRTFGLACFCALLAAATLMDGTSVRAGDNEDWCFSDQERTHDESIAGCTALIDGGRLSNDKLATAYANRCLAHTERNESDLAIADCTQSIAIDPGNAFTYAQRGDAYCQKGDIDHCVADYDQAMRIAPDDAAFPSLRGVARAAAGDAEGAITDLTKAIELDPVASNYTRRAGAYEAKGDRESAETDYRKALQLDPEDETAKQRLQALSK